MLTGNEKVTTQCGNLVGVETRVWDPKTQSRFIAVVDKLNKAHRDVQLDYNGFFESILKSPKLAIKGKNLYIDGATEDAAKREKLKNPLKRPRLLDEDEVHYEVHYDGVNESLQSSIQRDRLLAINRAKEMLKKTIADLEKLSMIEMEDKASVAEMLSRMEEEV